jgi:MFS family permease
VLLNGVCAFLRIFAVAPNDFWLLFALQTGVAAGQPFLYNAISKLCARWFPPAERATASGLANLGFFVGMLLSELFSSMLFQSIGLFGMLLVFGILGLVVTVAFIGLAKDHPEHPYGDTRRLEWAEIKGHMKNLFKNRFAIVHAVIGFIGIGYFNMLLTEIQNITAVQNVTDDQAGLIGAMVFIAGIIGLLILPALSDKLFAAGKTYARRLFMLMCFAVATPMLILLGFVADLNTVYILMAIIGFFLLSSFAIAMQWVAEGTAPIPESQSNNLLMYMGQIGGILFIWLVPAVFNTGTTAVPMYNNSMYLGAAFMLICFVLVFVLLRDKYLPTLPKAPRVGEAVEVEREE